MSAMILGLKGKLRLVNEFQTNDELTFDKPPENSPNEKSDL